LKPILFRRSILKLIASAFIGLLIASAPSGYADTSRDTELAPVATSEFLKQVNRSQVWSDANYGALVDAIEGLRAHGLVPEHYHLERLKSAGLSQAARDRLATDAWMSAAAHMLYGKLDPVSVEPNWTAGKRKADFISVLDYALSSGSVSTSLEQLAPIQPGYQLLKQELSNLRIIAETPIAKVTDGAPLKPGMINPRVTEIQLRLSQMGLLETHSDTGAMDEATVSAVQALQALEGLDADGIVGPATVRALNRDPQAKIDQVRVNLERWRWLPGDLGPRHLRANIAGFEVTAYENGEPQKTHLTIVGKTYRKTPVFSGEVAYIVYNPWWETPQSLARADKLPMFQKDPGSVERLGFEVLDREGKGVSPDSINWNDITAGSFPYRLRQAPGPQNALGLVKIMFPNRHNVYLHDTPSRGLFAQRQRAFSSGCLRTQDPVGLSEWLLSQTAGWERTHIDNAVASGKETRATLAAKIPVHVLYSTAVSDGLGGVRYLDDIYDRDRPVLKGLDLRPNDPSNS